MKKFKCENYPGLQIGVSPEYIKFEDGLFETDDPVKIESLLGIGDEYGVVEVVEEGASESQVAEAAQFEAEKKVRGKKRKALLEPEAPVPPTLEPAPFDATPEAPVDPATASAMEQLGFNG